MAGSTPTEPGPRAPAVSASAESVSAASARGFAPDPSRGVRATINASSVERAFSIIMAVGGIGFVATNIGTILEQIPELDPIWGVVFPAALGLTFVVVGVSGVVFRIARGAQVAVALVFLLALVTWPLTMHGHLTGTEVPWPYWLCNVATQAAALAFAAWRAVVYVVAVPVVYALIRLTPAAGSVPLDRALLDGLYILLLGGAGLALIVVVRRAAAGVDAAQATAVSRYARAIHEHATELERVQVDAIVHDSVLTTLISAARAHDDAAARLAASMATNAIDHLASASGRAEADAPSVPITVLRDRIAAAVRGLPAPITVQANVLDDRTVPAAVADAIGSAALQAAVNSVQHAGGPDVSRSVVVAGTVDGGVRVEVVDRGSGFDVASVPAERLGVRRSIIERVAVAGGTVDLDSVPGRGTRVVLAWSSSTADEAMSADAALSAADDALAAAVGPTPTDGSTP